MYLARVCCIMEHCQCHCLWPHRSWEVKTFLFLSSNPERSEISSIVIRMFSTEYSNADVTNPPGNWKLQSSGTLTQNSEKALKKKNPTLQKGYLLKFFGKSLDSQWPQEHQIVLSSEPNPAQKHYNLLGCSNVVVYNNNLVARPLRLQPSTDNNGFGKITPW